jgi:hypothetical protein
MTRATRAKWLALATALVVVLLVALFAALRNKPAPAGSAPAGVDASRLALGQRVYERLN